MAKTDFMNELTTLIDQRIRAILDDDYRMGLAEAAKAIRCRESTLRDALRNNELPAVKTAKAWSISYGDLKEWNETVRLKQLS